VALVVIENEQADRGRKVAAVSAFDFDCRDKFWDTNLSSCRDFPERIPESIFQGHAGVAAIDTERPLNNLRSFVRAAPMLWGHQSSFSLILVTTTRCLCRPVRSPPISLIDRIDHRSVIRMRSCGAALDGVIQLAPFTVFAQLADCLGGDPQPLLLGQAKAAAV
jgi:hypothetical protein